MLKWKNFFVTAGIVLIFTFFVAQGIDLFYPNPEWDDYCKGERLEPRKIAPENCSTYNQAVAALEEECYSEDGIPRPVYDSNGCQVDVTCDYCSRDFENAMDAYISKFFVIAAIVGILGIVLGALLFKVESVGAGLIGGGILLIVYASMVSWRYIGEAVRFLLLGLALALLVYLGYRINRKKK